MATQASLGAVGPTPTGAPTPTPLGYTRSASAIQLPAGPTNFPVSKKSGRHLPLDAQDRLAEICRRFASPLSNVRAHAAAEAHALVTSAGLTFDKIIRIGVAPPRPRPAAPRPRPRPVYDDALLAVGLRAMRAKAASLAREAPVAPRPRGRPPGSGVRPGAGRRVAGKAVRS